jgi:hypothetical protein
MTPASSPGPGAGSWGHPPLAARSTNASHAARAEYTLQASGSAHPHKAGEVYRLVTTIGDPDLAPAEDLAAA